MSVSTYETHGEMLVHAPTDAARCASVVLRIADQAHDQGDRYAVAMDSSLANSRLSLRFQRVLSHIDTHLDDALDIATLAALANYSPWHFQRQFTALFGLPVGRYQQTRRLQRAAQALAYRQDTVTGIALQAGYASLEAFTHAFQRTLGQSPSAFRAQPDWMSVARALTTPSNVSPMTNFADHLQILELPAIDLLTMSHCGDPRQLGDTLRRFIAWRREQGLHPARSRTFNVFHTPPDVPVDEFRMDVGVEVPAHRVREIDTRDVFVTRIPAARAAVISHAGSDSQMAAAFDWLYREWLPNSGEEPNDFPPWLERLDLGPDVPESQRRWCAVVGLT